MKARHVAGQRRHRALQPLLQAPDLPDASRDVPRSDTSPFLTMREAAVRMRYGADRGAETALRILRRHGVHLCRVGRQFLVRRDAVDRLIETGRGDIDERAAQIVGRQHRARHLASVAAARAAS